jgi:lysophospholipase L1-like esterase
MTVTRRTLLLCGAALLALTAAVRADDAATKPLPKLYLIGDSTVKNGTAGQVGWGDPIAAFFDPAKVTVVNRARGGRSSRTYLTEGLWDAVAAELKPGDFVLMQFGHNDGGPMDSGRARASIKGNGDETKEVTIQETGKKETVLSYGAYLRRYIADAKAKGATPIVLSPVPRNIFKDGKVGRSNGDYGGWAAEAARQGGAAFIDLNGIIADRYDALGVEKVAPLFAGTDHTHTAAAGAELNAECVVAGIKGLPGSPLTSYLSDKGKAVAACAPSQAVPAPAVSAVAGGKP